MTTKISKTRPALAISLAFLLSACISGYQLPGEITDAKLGTPPDVAAAAGLLENQLRGNTQPATSGITSAPGIVERIGEKIFKYGGFQRRHSKLITYTRSPGKEDGRIVAGRLGFEDPLGRRTEVLYYADYAFRGGTMHLTDIRAAPLFSPFPEAVMFVVPAKSVAAAGGLPKSHAGIINFLMANAVPTDAGKLGSETLGDYLIFVVLMDRISPSADFVVKISDKVNGLGGYKLSTEYLDIQGWRIGILPGRFDLSTALLYVKATYRAGKEVGFGGRYERMIGLYQLDLTKPPKL